MAMLLGGRSAEELVFAEITTGASDDIKRATRLARRMVCDFGMSEKIGPVFHGESEDQPFVGRDFGGSGREYSEQTAIEIDHEVRRIIREQQDRTRAVLTQHRDALERLAHALLDRETLDAEEILACFEGRPLPARARPVIPSWAERRERKDSGGRPAKVTSIFPPPRGVPSGA
jgi:cell division protease FtsH